MYDLSEIVFHYAPASGHGSFFNVHSAVIENMSKTGFKITFVVESFHEIQWSFPVPQCARSQYALCNLQHNLSHNDISTNAKET